MLKWILWFLIKTVGLIPFRIRSNFGAAVGYLFALFPTRDRTIAEMQIKCFLKPANPRKIVREVYSNMGRTFFECLDIKELLKNPDKYIHFPAWPDTEKLLSENRGLVALSAHIGNWDAMGVYFADKQVPLLAVAKQMRNPNIHFILEKLRNSFGFRTLWRASKRGVREILNALEAGQAVAVLIDQDTRVESIAVPFFKVDVSTPSTIIELGKKADALFASVFVVRNADNKFEILFRQIPADLPVPEILKLYNQHLEELIRVYPSQWAWVHKRWRTLPSGIRLGGVEYLSFLKEIEKNAGIPS